MTLKAFQKAEGIRTFLGAVKEDIFKAAKD